jgi:uncharacterized integral membrane protein
LKYLSWLLGLLLFLLALGFAIKNTGLVTVAWYLGYAWHAPLMLVLLAAFVAGVASGIVAGLSYIVRQRREILGLKRELRLKSQVSRPDIPDQEF